jgi:hydroxypyruvate isomerase
MKKSHYTRRDALKTIAGATAMTAMSPLFAADLKGNIKQSVCLWCYNGYMNKNNMNLDQFAAACAEMGLKSIELTGPGEWPTLKKHGLICAMVPATPIDKGLNRIENHDSCLATLKKKIDESVENGFPNVITMSGNTAGMDKQEGLDNCVIALKKIAPYAEEKGITICMEFLNSINHKDYMGDSTAWFVELIKKVGSPRVKVLYDIYHAAMMKEDPMADIQKHADCWGHYHTGGMPGRNEIDSTQTLDYPALMKAILATGYTGYVGQEFIPKKEDGLASLRAAVKLCDV